MIAKIFNPFWKSKTSVVAVMVISDDKEISGELTVLDGEYGDMSLVKRTKYTKYTKALIEATKILEKARNELRI